MRPTDGDVLGEQEAIQVIEDIISRRMFNTGEDRDVAVKNIIKYLESVYDDKSK